MFAIMKSNFIYFTYYYYKWYNIYGSGIVDYSLLNKNVQITLHNGKILRGLFKSYDSKTNSLLIDTSFISKEKIANMRKLDDIEEHILLYNTYIEYERRLSKNTIAGYNNDLFKYHEYLSKNNINKVKDITKKDINDYLIELTEKEKLTTKSLARKLTTIKNFHTFLFQHEYIPINVASSIERPKLVKSLPKVLTVEEIDQLLDIELNTIFDYRDKAMLELLYASGLRISELLSLTMNDIDLENCLVRCMGKGKKERMIPIGEYVIDSMNNYLDKRTKLYLMNKDEHLFLNNHGKVLSRSGFFKMLKHRLSMKQINVDVSPHTLRHSFATHMLENGSDLRTVQELLGHADISTTRIYTHISNQKVKNDYETYHPRSKK